MPDGSCQVGAEGPDDAVPVREHHQQEVRAGAAGAAAPRCAGRHGAGQRLPHVRERQPRSLRRHLRVCARLRRHCGEAQPRAAAARRAVTGPPQPVAVQAAGESSARLRGRGRGRHRLHLRRGLRLGLARAGGLGPRVGPRRARVRRAVGAPAAEGESGRLRGRSHGTHAALLLGGRRPRRAGRRRGSQRAGRGRLRGTAEWTRGALPAATGPGRA
mmetsp:Transcript_39184/g.101345  ORF Transcript_39184/g.101345 Transcript_39184/m.101345 type:complete len:216 (+) Transcript_39184:1976-2623(+)